MSRTSKKVDKIEWIERVLDSSVSDGSLKTVENVLAPYLITIKGMDPTEAEGVLLDWLDKCECESRVNVKEFVARVCWDVHVFKKKPKALEYLQEHNRFYNRVVKLVAGPN